MPDDDSELTSALRARAERLTVQPERLGRLALCSVCGARLHPDTMYCPNSKTAHGLKQSHSIGYYPIWVEVVSVAALEEVERERDKLKEKNAALKQDLLSVVGSASRSAQRVAERFREMEARVRRLEDALRRAQGDVLNVLNNYGAERQRLGMLAYDRITAALAIDRPSRRAALSPDETAEDVLDPLIEEPLDRRPLGRGRLAMPDPPEEVWGDER